MPERNAGIGMPPTMGNREWALLLVLAVIWGSSFFFYKILVNTLPPLTVVLGRVGIAAVIMNLWLIFRRDFIPASPRLWLSFTVMGVLNNIIPFTLIAVGETRITSGLASILNATTPLFTILLAHWLTANERLTPAKGGGILLGFAGVAVLIGPDALLRLGHGNLVGQLACLLGAVSYAFAGIYGRRFKGQAPIKVATGQITSSSLVLIPLVAFVDHPWRLPMPTATTWGAMAGIAVLCTVVAYALYFEILSAAGATNLLLVTFLLPVTALLLGWLLLAEPISLRTLGGMALIGIGLATVDGRLPRLLLRRSLGTVV
jgi:drug/metabolite transporter (DMT)-like permease